MSKEKVRVFALARELNMESKDLIALCQENGIEIKNQLATLEAEVRDRVLEIVRTRKSSGPAPTTPAAAASQPLPDAPGRIRNLDSRPRPAAPRVEPAAPTPVAPAPAPEEPAAPAPAAKAAPDRSEPPAAPPAPVAPIEPPVAPRAEEPPSPPPVVPPVELPPAAAKPAEVTPPSAPPAPPAPPRTPPSHEPPRALPPGGSSRPPNLNTPRPGRTPDRPRPIVGGGRQPQMIIGPRPQKTLKDQRQSDEKKPAQPAGPTKLAEIPADLPASGGNVIDMIMQRKRAEAARAAATGSTPAPAPTVEEDDEEARGKGKGGAKARPGAIVGRDARHKERNLRQERRKAVAEIRGVGLLEEDGPAIRKLRRQKRERLAPTQPRKGKVPVTLPITVRSLSEAIGIKSAELLLKLMNHGLANLNINTTLEPILAETVALENGCELEIKKPLDAEEQILADLEKPDDEADLMPRAPIVTIMGHVDHGKTSLLDRIRQSNVVDTEAGGITQVLRAWRVTHAGHPITFLDTPGHEAFTKMRARGANVTDIAVIVVAAGEGVMPQTEEAISHAKAAGVSVVVALNKIDLPQAKVNLEKTKQQLYSLSVLPDDMGGDSPFVQTSAVTGKGIDDLLEAISVVAELKELKANPNKAARGTCLEANLDEGEGVLATILVQDGTLRRGDVVLCGSAYGRIRALYDDLGRPIAEAGPSVPCRITGLDIVPNADDPFVVVPELTTAREIAERRKLRAQEASLIRRGPVTLESLGENKIAELKVILKADFRGSIEAIRKELEKLHHEEVRVRLLHTAIGGISESDVQLALTSPEDTLIVGFNVVPDNNAMALAGERGIQIREYDVIYKLTDDLRAALEGKLKPREDIIHLGRAVVRETFKISRVGTIAGCYVTQGTIERSAKVRVIRNGVVIYPPADRTASLESLKRFKEDSREVREGFECGLKIAGYDDVKPDDVIEAYRIEQVQRTLS